MKSVDFRDRLYSIKTQKTIGTPNELGHITCGASFYGEYFPMAGVYRNRKVKMQIADNYTTSLGALILGQNRLATLQYKNNSGVIQSRCVVKYRQAFPDNPQTDVQQSWRNYFKTVLQSWQAMTENEKDVWRKQQYPRHMSGWNRYARIHLKAKDL